MPPEEPRTEIVTVGTGELAGVTFENVTYEGRGPAGSTFIVDILTDNKNRTVGEIRNLFSKNGGNLAQDGAVAWMFEQKGKVVVIDFFASWCEPCMRELPELEKLHRELAPAGVVFVGVNLDKERKNVEALVKRFGLSFSVVHDPDGKVAEAYDPPKMPSTYVVDKAGIVRHINAGFEGAADVAKLRKQVTSLGR